MNKLLAICLLLCIGYTSAAYDEQLAINMAYASGLSYCPAARVMSGKCGEATTKTTQLGITPLYAKDVGTAQNSITEVIMSWDSKKTLIVGYSGTRDPNQLINEILKSFPRDYSIHPETKSMVMDYFYEFYLNGFRTDFLAKIKGYLATTQYANYNMIFTGHSLGGAMTVHAAADFVLSGLGNNRQVRIYTYGQPRVGGNKFSEAVHSKVTEWYRVVHNKDVVAHIPPCLPDLDHSCLKDGPLPYYPYHSPEEIYYDEPCSHFKACSLTNGEDPSCSNDELNTSVPDHLVYFGIDISSINMPKPFAEDMLKEDSMIASQ